MLNVKVIKIRQGHNDTSRSSRYVKVIKIRHVLLAYLYFEFPSSQGSTSVKRYDHLKVIVTL